MQGESAVAAERLFGGHCESHTQVGTELDPGVLEFVQGVDPRLYQVRRADRKRG